MAILGSLEVLFKGNTKQFDKSLNKVQARLRKVSQTFQNVGRNMTLFVTAPIVAMGAAIVKAASDAEETANKFNVVFKKVSKDANKMASHLALAYGISREESERLLSNTGDLLTGFGFTAAAALDLSNNVQKLAADLGSFNNISTERASAALTKGLLGEREAMKTLGIAIREADIQAKLAEKGQKGLTGQALLAAKAQATFELAVQQSGNAMGDFARSSQSFANQQRIMSARFKDLQASLGKVLLPMLTKLIGHIIRLVDWFNNLSPVAKKALVIFAGIAAALGPVLFIIGKIMIILPYLITAVKAVAIAMASVTWEVWLVVAAVAALILVVRAIIGAWDDIKSAADRTWKFVVAVHKFAFATIIRALSDMLDFIGLGFDDFATQMEDSAQSSIDEWEKVRESGKSWGEAFSSIADNLESDVMGMVDSITSIGTSTKETTKEVEKLNAELNKTGNGGQARTDTSGVGPLFGPTAIQPGSTEPGISLPTAGLTGFIEQTDLIAAAVQNATAEIQTAILTAGALNEQIDVSTLQTEVWTNAFLSLVEQGLNPFDERLVQLRENIKATGEETQTFGQLMVTGIQKAMPALERSLARGADSFQNYARNIGQTVREIIKMSLAAATAALVERAIKDGAKIPFLGVAAAPVLAAAAAGIVSTAFNALVPAFAQGGMVTGPTLAQVGDNASGREAIIPFERMGEFIKMATGNNIGAQQIVVTGVLRGEDLFLVQDQYLRNQNFRA